MFPLDAGIHLPDNDSLYWQEHQQHAPYSILKMSVNRM
jgi:hypothetical protein